MTDSIERIDKIELLEDLMTYVKELSLYSDILYSYFVGELCNIIVNMDPEYVSALNKGDMLIIQQLNFGIVKKEEGVYEIFREIPTSGIN